MNRTFIFLFVDLKKIYCSYQNTRQMKLLSFIRFKVCSVPCSTDGLYG